QPPLSPNRLTRPSSSKRWRISQVALRPLGGFMAAPIAETFLALSKVSPSRQHLGLSSRQRGKGMIGNRDGLQLFGRNDINRNAVGQDVPAAADRLLDLGNGESTIGRVPLRIGVSQSVDGLFLARLCFADPFNKSPFDICSKSRLALAYLKQILSDRHARYP